MCVYILPSSFSLHAVELLPNVYPHEVNTHIEKEKKNCEDALSGTSNAKVKKTGVKWEGFLKELLIIYKMKIYPSVDIPESTYSVSDEEKFP